jgi:hypothetical protein
MMALRMGTAQLHDDEFVEAFESCRLPGDQFHHEDHLRLAWIYLRQQGMRETEARLLRGIPRFAAHHGSPGKFHHTMTIAWLRRGMRNWRKCRSWSCSRPARSSAIASCSLSTIRRRFCRVKPRARAGFPPIYARSRPASAPRNRPAWARVYGSRLTGTTGTSLCARRISNRRCSSRWKVSWSGKSLRMRTCSVPGSTDAAMVFQVMVTR